MSTAGISHVEAWTVLCWHAAPMKVVIFTQQLLFFALLPDEIARAVIVAGRRGNPGMNQATATEHDDRPTPA
jgi:hypothetical protein